MDSHQAVTLVRRLADASVRATMVANGLRRGSEDSANRAEAAAARDILAALLGRTPTADEARAVAGE